MRIENRANGAAATGREAAGATTAGLPWRDTALPRPERVADLLARMTLEEKVAQLYGVWVGADASGDGVAPHQHDLSAEPVDWHSLIASGIGQLTRPFGTAAVDPALGARALARTQAEIVAANRHGIPAMVHEECLSGFMTWKATIFPAPLAWGATFDTALIERMGSCVGSAMRSVGVHQGLAPVLDVTRDYRWGRVEETIGEDPYLVATIGTAYVRGIESAGVVSTLKHFVGYSASRAGRNFAPVSMGPREVADVLLPSFEMAIRDGGARSVMHSYAEIDGVPAAANRHTLTTILRDRWGFEGTVVADYFGISFLRLLHGVAASDGDAAAVALEAGVDVELPTVHCYGAPLVEAVRAGRVPESYVDRAAARVLAQKCELGLLDAHWSPGPSAIESGPAEADGAGPAHGSVDLDPAESRELARAVAEESVVLLANSGVLPLPPRPSVALIGPCADDPSVMLGCYTFPNHVTGGPGANGADGASTANTGVEIPTLHAALREELAGADITYARGCEIQDAQTSGFAEAVTAARAAELCVVALGDRSGLFGRGTSGEGCDVEDLRLPGVQEDLLMAVLDTGTPVVLVVISGRPYALGRCADRVAAVVQAFFPGEEGARALAAVLSGRVDPSGRLPVSVPRSPGGQPATYLTPALGLRSEVSSVDPTPLWPFGHGLSYTSFSWGAVRADPAPAEPGEPVVIPTDGVVEVSLTVTNTGARAGTEIVQLYLHDPVAQVTRAENRLVGYARVPLDAGRSGRVSFRFWSDLSSFTGRDGDRVVEPGDLELRFGSSSGRIRQVVPLRLTGPERVVDSTRHLTAGVTVAPQ